MVPTVEELEIPEIVDFFKKMKENEIESKKEHAEVEEQHELPDLSFLKKLATKKRKKMTESVKLSR